MMIRRVQPVLFFLRHHFRQLSKVCVKFAILEPMFEPDIWPLFIIIQTFKRIYFKVKIAHTVQILLLPQYFNKIQIRI